MSITPKASASACSHADGSKYAVLFYNNRHDFSHHMCKNQQCSMLDPIYTTDHIAEAPPIIAQHVWTTYVGMCTLTQTLEEHYDYIQHSS
eukprot:4614694-Amphidinium_carterae.2